MQGVLTLSQGLHNERGVEESEQPRTIWRRWVRTASVESQASNRREMLLQPPTAFM